MNASYAARRKKALHIICVLRKATADMPEPAAALIIQKYGKDPYIVLISCILSLRTRDTVSYPASLKLFEHATTPESMLKLSLETIMACVKSVGFYKTKAATILSISAKLLDEHNGIVPANKDDLLSFKGIGIKTANLVLGEAFEIPAICVDTHVHYLSNRLGIVDTKTPEETEPELCKILPQEHWIEYNTLMVKWGQNKTIPLAPWCQECPPGSVCPQVSIGRRSAPTKPLSY